MSSMITNPEYLSKDRLKEELTKYKVKYSPNQNKDHYVQLYREKILRRASTGKMTTSRLEFSSGDEMASRRSLPTRQKRYTKVFNVDHFLEQTTKMSDTELKRRLKQFDVDVGPITDTTRGLYAKKLARLMVEDAKGGVSRSSSGVTDDYVDLSSGVDSEQGAEEEEEDDEEEEKEEKASSTQHKGGGISLAYQHSRSREILQQQPSVSISHVRPKPTPSKFRPKPTPPPQKAKPLTAPARVAPPTQQSNMSWIVVQLLVLAVTFVIALIVFDYMMYGNSRVIEWIKNQHENLNNTLFS